MVPEIWCGRIPGTGYLAIIFTHTSVAEPEPEPLETKLFCEAGAVISYFGSGAPPQCSQVSVEDARMDKTNFYHPEKYFLWYYI